MIYHIKSFTDEKFFNCVLRIPPCTYYFFLVCRSEKFATEIARNFLQKARTGTSGQIDEYILTFWKAVYRFFLENLC